MGFIVAVAVAGLITRTVLFVVARRQLAATPRQEPSGCDVSSRAGDGSRGLAPMAIKTVWGDGVFDQWWSASRAELIEIGRMRPR